MQKHYVNFYSPGSFIAEVNQVPIDRWDVDQAVELARRIKQRHGATPYGFNFTTREVNDSGRSVEINRSAGMYYLGGRVETYEMILVRNDPSEEILRWNMKMNNISRILVNTNSYKSTHELRDSDIVLDYDIG